MKRDWDLIRDVLLEVEALPRSERQKASYGLSEGTDPATSEDAKAEHALLLWRAGYLEGVDSSSIDGDSFFSPELTWQGHELLDMIRSRGVWERVKAMACEKGIELTFDAVKALAAAAVGQLLA